VAGRRLRAGARTVGRPVSAPLRPQAAASAAAAGAAAAARAEAARQAAAIRALEAQVAERRGAEDGLARQLQVKGFCEDFALRFGSHVCFGSQVTLFFHIFPFFGGGPHPSCAQESANKHALSFKP
jgi:hypothetical protein